MTTCLKMATEAIRASIHESARGILIEARTEPRVRHFPATPYLGKIISSRSSLVHLKGRQRGA